MRSFISGLCLLLLTMASASGQTCNFSISGINFGSVDLITGAAVDATGTLNINCTGVPLTSVRICPNIGAGTGGATSTSRQMVGASAMLNYQLYSNAARTTVWGSYNWAFTDRPPTIDLAIGLGGSASTTRTIFARLLAGQTTAPATSYTSLFTAAHTQFSYGLVSTSGCPNILVAQTANPTFTVSALGVNNCSVTATNINFGPQGVLSTNVDASGQVLATCTIGTAYSISLDGGGANAAPAARQMTSGGNIITYGLFQNVARNLAWGSSVGIDTVAGTGTGSPQALTVFARVPPQSTPPPGIYSDTIIVTVTY